MRCSVNPDKLEAGKLMQEKDHPISVLKQESSHHQKPPKPHLRMVQWTTTEDFIGKHWASMQRSECHSHTPWGHPGCTVGWNAPVLLQTCVLSAWQSGTRVDRWWHLPQCCCSVSASAGMQGTEQSACRKGVWQGAFKCIQHHKQQQFVSMTFSGAEEFTFSGKKG